jgi:hypothetical protein
VYWLKWQLGKSANFSERNAKAVKTDRAISAKGFPLQPFHSRRGPSILLPVLLVGITISGGKLRRLM